jgi:hypothetical protein
VGIVNFGIDPKAVKAIKNRYGLMTFVEGGTFLGGTAKQMSTLFDSVITIEMTPEIHQKAKASLEPFANVNAILGDTRSVLHSIISSNDNILFWLDSHWSGGITYGSDDECPLMDELRIIFSSSLRNYVIMIDDARLFLSPPPKPHNLGKWPGIADIFGSLPLDRKLFVWNDVIYILPRPSKPDDLLQELITDEWTAYRKARSNIFKKIVFKVLSFANR